MNKTLLLSLLSFVSTLCLTQTNLVINPSFEAVNLEQSTTEKIGKKYTHGWHSPTANTPTFYSLPNKDVAVAANGKNSVGLVLGGSKQEKTKLEYITGELSSPLKSGEVYCVCFSLLLHRASNWSATDLGILLHQEKELLSNVKRVQTLTPSLILDDGNPIKNTKWRKYCSYYVATGGEAFISFGKFGESASVKLAPSEQYRQIEGNPTKAYYQVDNFKVVPSNSISECGCAEKIQIPEEEDVTTKSLYAPYLFALDGSGSMKKQGVFDSLRTSLTTFVETLPFEAPLSFVTFAGSAKSLYVGKKEEKTTAILDSLLSNVRNTGGTNVFAGLQMAYNSRIPESPDSAKIILISDGSFTVKSNIVNLVRSQYETYGRKLTIIQINAKASGIELLDPYLDDYIYTTRSEVKSAIKKIKRYKNSAEQVAVACECPEELSDTVNYHFVIDYSGSMVRNKDRAILAMNYLYKRVPDNAMVSITSFDTQADVLYFGPKTDLSEARLGFLMSIEIANGGTSPRPAVERALLLAKEESYNRLSQLILVTDVSLLLLNSKKVMKVTDKIAASASEIDLEANTLCINSDGMVLTHSQFDFSSNRFVNVPRKKFENDLFEQNFSNCNYTTQPYHYNTTVSAMRGVSKRVMGTAAKVLKDKVLEGY